jgi:hypothetical protein
MELNTNLPLHPAPELDHPNSALPDHASAETEDELIASIDRKFRAGVEAHVSAGIDLIKLKKVVLGRFTGVVHRRGWNLDYAEKLMAIGRTFPDSATLRSLPSSWTTLHLLARLPKNLRESWIADGTIHPKTTYRGAEALLRKARGLNDRGGRGDDADAGGREQAQDAGHSEDHEDHDGEDHGEVVNQAEVRGDGGHGQQAEGGDAVRADVGPNSQGEIDRKLARLEELERQASFWDAQRVGLERRLQDLEAKLDETNVPCQRRLFRQALESLQRAELSDISEKEKRFHRNSALTDLIGFVHAAARDGLGLHRFDVFCRQETH